MVFLSFFSAFLLIVFRLLDDFRLISASRILHNNLLKTILQAPMSFFDTTPFGRIINRFSQDISTIDHSLQYSISGGIESTCLVCCSLIIIIYSTPWFLVALIPLSILYIMLQVNIDVHLKSLLHYTSAIPI